MDNKIILKPSDVEKLCLDLGTSLAAMGYLDTKNPGKCYAIPRGGIPAAYALISEFGVIWMVDTPEEADFFFDDIIDSGATMKDWCERYPEKPFFALIDRSEKDCRYPEGWIVFPWEVDAETGIEDNIRRVIEFAGDDASRGGLLETPRRVAKALSHWFSGYGQDPAEILKVFEDGAENYNQMIVVKNIPIYSKCEHHMADIFGTATIAYIPNGKIVGLSKLSRLANIFARRLQVQERLTQQIAQALMDNLEPKGVGVVIKARHMCMESRGICQQGHHTITTALHGALFDEPSTRAEFFQHVNSKD